MKVSIEKVTDEALFRKACQSTMRGSSKVPLRTMYAGEHSPIRTQLFWIELADVPTFVSVHLVRHKMGIEHYVRTNRDDRGGADRNTPNNHSFLVNAAELIFMARKRLCHKAHEQTREVMQEITLLMAAIDPELCEFLVPECIYRGGFCWEPSCCGKVKEVTWVGGKRGSHVYNRYHNGHIP